MAVRNFQPIEGSHYVVAQYINRKTELEWPILAPMAEFTTPALAAAISNAGGMGALGMWGYSAEEVIDRISGFRELSDGGWLKNSPDPVRSHCRFPHNTTGPCHSEKRVTWISPIFFAANRQR